MNLFYREYGSGYPLIILHGLYGSSDNWISIADDLSDSYRVILPDQRNHGRSAHDPVHTYEAMSSDLLELVNKLEIREFILAGHSMGGKTASFFACRQPGMLSGLVIIDISPFRQDPEEITAGSIHHKILKKMTETDPSELRNREEADKLFSEFISSEKVRNFLLKNLKRNREGSFKWKLNPGNLYNNLDNIFEGLKMPDNTDNKIIRGFPVFFLRAMDSAYIKDQDYHDIQAVFPAAEIIEVPGSSHWIHAEKPGVITGLLRDNFPV